MVLKKLLVTLAVFIACIVSLVGSAAANHVAEVTVKQDGLYWQPKVPYAEIVLNIAAPDGTVYQKTFKSGTPPYITLSDSIPFIDGPYTYELKVIPAIPGANRQRQAQERETGLETANNRVHNPLTQTGYFRVEEFQIVIPGASENNQRKMKNRQVELDGSNIGVKYTYNENLIVTGSLCVGIDCLTDESFGFDTIKLKENNLRIFFDDTSLAPFPANDWRIVVNDSSSGGGNYFAIEDSTGGNTPFKIEAAARNNSLYVNSSGRVGLGTSTPALNLHVLYGDTPSLRLDQDASSGFTAQVWDIAGNESNFFIRETTGSSHLPFRIQPGAPTNTLTLRSEGKVGIGTWTPNYPLHLETTGKNATFIAKRTDGATNYINATENFANFGSISNHPVRIMVNAQFGMRLDVDKSLTMGSGATCTTGGVWTDASSRDLKENIRTLSSHEALVALNDLNPVKYNYRADSREKHVGFIAEDVPELVASKSRKGLSPMDIVAVLTKVVQEQQKTIETLNKKIDTLEHAQRAGR